ncbi:MAG: acyltransferase [Planctomyces sp.]|nr:acyltransferase [Planctomyces sp.]
MKSILKQMVRMICTILVLPAVALCRLQAVVGGRDRAFSGWSQFFALFPGLCGVHLRHAFCRQVMSGCADGAWIGFGTIFSHAGASIGKSAYIGNFCSIGDVAIEDDVLIASHVSIMNGCRQHGTARLDIPIREQPGVYEPVTIGRDSWIGEHATVAASVGKHCIIGAGSVVLKPIPDYSIAVGVPARVIRDRRTLTEGIQNSGESSQIGGFEGEGQSHQQALDILQAVTELRTAADRA